MNAILTNKEFLEVDYRKTVVLEIADTSSDILRNDGWNDLKDLPSYWKNKKIIASRTGNRSFQPIISDNGWFHNIYGCHIKRVLTPRECPELFRHIDSRNVPSKAIYNIIRQGWRISFMTTNFSQLDDETYKYFSNGRDFSNMQFGKIKILNRVYDIPKSDMTSDEIYKFVYDTIYEKAPELMI